MKKIYAALFCLVGAMTSSYANPGDTTIVQAQHSTHLPSHGNYDTAITFPNGSVPYRKVIMSFTLGKFDCGGNYNPSNPGEGSSQTGWCSDWDYDIEVYLMTPTDTIELGRLITPYANSTMPRLPLTWSHDYLFDVSDYYTLLKNNAQIRIGFMGWSSGFTGSVKFLMMEGTPARNVVGVSPIWSQSSDYGDASNPIDNNITAKTLTFPSTATYGEERVFITGHGSDNTGCSEFCKKWYKFMVNGAAVEQTNIWRDDCGSNFLYPQSGTWVYDRGNWCPGDLVRVNTHKVPSSVTPGSTFTTDLDFQPYTGTVPSGSSRGAYKVSGAMVFFGAFNHTVDAGIESIVSPNNDETYYRSNPICGSPEITVKNFGSSAVTSIDFEYGIEGQTLATYTWTNNLASLVTASVSLPALASLNTVTGSNNKFIVRIVKVNGVTDGESFNNEMKSTFKAAADWNGGNFVVNLKMSASANGNVNKTNWTITDASGTVVAQRQGTVSSTLYSDTVHLANGCYKLNVDASYLGYGLRNPYAWANSNAGYFRVNNLIDGSLISIDKNQLGTSAYQGNLESYFGNGFTESFRVSNATGINDAKVSAYSLNVYPNPARTFIKVDVYGIIKNAAQVTLVNVLGQVVYTVQTKEKNITIPTENLANGIYTLSYNTGDNQKVEKVVISK